MWYCMIASSRDYCTHTDYSLITECSLAYSQTGRVDWTVVIVSLYQTLYVHPCVTLYCCYLVYIISTYCIYFDLTLKNYVFACSVMSHFVFDEFNKSESMLFENWYLVLSFLCNSVRCGSMCVVSQVLSGWNAM